MKKFIYKTLIFGGWLFLFFGINGLMNFFNYKNESIDLEKKNVLIMGDSHTERGLNPSIILNAVNVSQSSEPYVLTYWKLKKILANNTISTLLLSFSYHNLSSFNDNKFTELNIGMDEMFKRSYPIEEFDLAKGLKVDKLGFYKVLFKQTCFYPKTTHVYYLGAYENKVFTNLNKVQTTIGRHYYNEAKEYDYSAISIGYLDSIVNLCISCNVKPVFVTPPVHRSYYDKVPTKFILKYSQLKKEYIKRGVLVISDEEGNYADSLFYDADHLNTYGANKYSQKVLSVLNRKSIEY